MRDCDVEFGEDHTHDDVECAQTLGIMGGAGMDDWLAYEQEVYSREAEESRLGRPLFPNEY